MFEIKIEIHNSKIKLIFAPKLNERYFATTLPQVVAEDKIN